MMEKFRDCWSLMHLFRYVYTGEKGPYIAPKEPVPISQGRLLAGMYGISEVVPEKK